MPLFEENNISVVSIPANCTDHLKPLDINKTKQLRHLHSKFQEWYSEQGLPTVEYGTGYYSL